MFRLAARAAAAAALLLAGAAVVATATASPYNIVAPLTLRAGASASIALAPALGGEDGAASSPVEVVLMLLESGAAAGERPVAAGPWAATWTPGAAAAAAIALPADLAEGAYDLVAAATGYEELRAEVAVLAPAGSVLLLELDKPVYKPGQTVRLRALAMGADLRPAAGESLAVTITNPDGVTIAKWARDTDASGAVELTLPTSVEPSLGDYSVQAESAISGTAATATFAIDEYVLPRFEVALDMDAAIVRGDSELHGTVSATYTYGEQVEGEVTVNVYYQQRYYNYLGGFGRGGPEQAVGVSNGGDKGDSGVDGVLIATYTGLIDGSTALELTLTADRDAYDSIFYSSDGLIVEALVTESATGAEASATTTVVASESPYSVQLISDRFFVPGLPMKVRAVATAAGGGAREGQKLNLKATFNQQWDRNGCTRPQSLDLSATVTTGADGSAVATFDVPDDAESCSFSLPEEAEFEGEEKDAKFDDFDYGGGGNANQPVSSGCCYNSMYVRLESSDSSVYASGTSERARSLSGSALVLSPAFALDAPLRAGSTASFSVLWRHASTPSVRWYVLAGTSGVVAHGVLDSGSSTDISFAVTDAMAPSASLLAVYAGANGEVVADEVAFEVTAAGVEGHEVAAAFSADAVMPGDAVSVTVSAEPGARAFLLAVDRSVRLLGGSSALSAESVVQAKLAAAEEPTRSACRERWARSVLAQAGAALLTSAPIAECSVFANSGGGGGGFYLDDAEMAFDGALPVMAMAMGAEEDSVESGNAAGGAKVEQTSVKRVRKFFPEAWLWTSATVGEDGHLELPQTAPDSITTWELSAFATSAAVGLGVAPEVGELVVKKDLFVSPRLPYSVVRGESAVVPVGIFNYMPQAADVTLSLRESPGVAVIGGLPTAPIRVPADGSAAVEMLVNFTELGTATLSLQATTPASVGASDAVSRTVLVKPEGFEREDVQNVLIDLREGASQETHSLEAYLPRDVVPGSARAYLTAIGDVMGPTLSGLERLLQMPFGCGEQNMISMAPNVYIASYLEAVGKLGADTEERAVGNMLVGYQRELNYRHPNGGFSAFGTQDDSASTWLTAFVLKVFAQAASAPYRFIEVDAGVLSQAAAFLASTQERDGHFDEVGDVIHTEMQGGAANPGDALTAFVLTALAEARRLPELESAAESAASEAVAALSGRLGRLSGYPLAISAAALAKACSGDSAVTGCPSDVVEEAVDALMADAIEEGGLAHWGASGAHLELPHGDDAMYHHPRATSSEVEATAYALQALLAAGRQADAAPAARWLLAQRNAHGGFASTQDTVVALEALAEYAAALMASQGEVALTATASTGTEVASFIVDAENSLVLQQASVPVGGVIDVRASGDGLALVQLVLRYSVATAPVEPAYVLRVSYANDTSRPSGALSVTACASVDPSSPNAGAARGSGMVLLQPGLFSGYVADSESLNELSMGAPDIVKRADANGGSADIYLSGVGDEEVCVQFRANKDADVHDLKPATSTVFAYYVPELAGGDLVEPSAVTEELEREDGNGEEDDGGSSVSVGDAPVGDEGDDSAAACQGGVTAAMAAVAIAAAVCTAMLC